MATRKKAKKLVSARFDQNMIDALDELSLGAGEVFLFDKETCKKMSRTNWIEYIVNVALGKALLREIKHTQIEGFWGDTELFRLFTTYARANRKVKGYVFTSHSKEDRFVFGPRPEGDILIK